MEHVEGVPAEEVTEFPTSNKEELARLRELVSGMDVEIIDLGDFGYVINNKRLNVTAESPWILTDFDDTGAKTSEDKETCKKRLTDLGISEETIKYADKKARVNFGGRGMIYEPILDKIFLTLALENGLPDEQIKLLIDEARSKLLNSKQFFDYPINEAIETIYNETRYTSTLYHDTLDTLLTLKDYPSGMANNLVIFTYGDPVFQLTKVRQMLRRNETTQMDVVNQIWLAKSRKGDFFEALVEKNIFKDSDIHYHYPETERGIGIPFADPKWQTKILLFDDDPDQVGNFNRIADKMGIAGLGTARVRRQGVKRSGTETAPHERTTEIFTSDTLLDSELFHKAMTELQVRALERSVVEVFRKFGPEAVRNGDLANEVEAISIFRGSNFNTVVRKLNQKAGSFVD